MRLVVSKANLKKFIIISIIGCLFLVSVNAAAIEVAPRITDKEIIEALANIRGDIKEIRAEIKGLQQQIAELKNSTQQQIAELKNSTQQQIAELKDGQKVLGGRIDTLIYAVWGSFAALMGCFVALIGFVIWDRRTAISPAIRKNKELEEEQEKIKREFQEEHNKVKKALKEYANKEPRLAEILRNMGIM